MSAVDLNSNVINRCDRVEVSGDSILVTRPIYEGKLFEKVTASVKPQLITLRGRAFPKPEQQEGTASTAAQSPSGSKVRCAYKCGRLQRCGSGVSFERCRHYRFRRARRIE
jgi:electron transfer flavoprotein alpha subunit